MLKEVKGGETPSSSFEGENYSKQETFEPNATDANPSDAAQGIAWRPGDVRYTAWSVMFWIFLVAGVWGILGGWLLGLPIGGETRRDVFGDRNLGWRDLLVTIPHPDLTEVPIFSAGNGAYFVRNKFASVTGLQRSTAIRRQAPPSDIANQSKQAQTKQDAPESGLRDDFPFDYYVTRFASSQKLFTSSPVLFSTPTDYCLAVKVDGTSFCVALPKLKAGEERAYSIADWQKGNPPPETSSPLVTQSGVSSSFSIGRELNSGNITTIALSAVPSPSTDFRPQSLWAGTATGEIFSMTLKSPSLLSVTRLDSPFDTRIDLIVFASLDRGWVWAGAEGRSRAKIAQTSDGGASWHALPERWLPAPWVFVALIFSAIAFERASSARLHRSRPPAVKHIAEHGVSDNPIGLDDADALGLRPIAASMARFLRNIETKPTVAIGIVGPWGSGKTSLMNLVRQELAARNIRTVWFNAWHNQKEENLLAALLASIRSQAVPPFWTISGFVHRGRIAWKRLGADLNATIALLICVGVGLAVLVYNAENVARTLTQLWTKIAYLIGAMGAEQKGLAPDATSALKSIGLSTGGITAIIFAAVKLWDLFKPLKSIPAELLSTLNGDSTARDLNQQLSFRYRFASEFAVFCEVLRRPPHPGVVIFIDDLDRCGPRQTVDILEAINFVTSVGPCFVVLGLDESKVRAAIADSYKDMTLRLDPADPVKLAGLNQAQLQQQKLADLSAFATRYLEKLIHLVVPVPRSRKDSVERLLGVVPSNKASTEAPRWRKPVQTALSILGTTAVVGFLMSMAWLGIDLVTNKLPGLVSAPAATTTVQTSRRLDEPKQDAQMPAANPVQAATPPVPAIASIAELDSSGLMSPGMFESIPAPLMVAVFALILIFLSYQFLPRLQTEPVISDGPDFVEALQVSSEGISRTRETPRAVKRFINRVRFMAMRLRDIPIDTSSGPVQLKEADLVAMAAIEDLNAEYLGETEEGLRRRAASEQAPELVLTLSLLEQFRDKFQRSPYDDRRAVEIYRILAGLVAEGRDVDPADRSAS